MKKISIAFCIIMALLPALAVAGGDATSPTTTKNRGAANMAEITTGNPVIRIATSKGDMLAELYEDECPNTVANMIALAEDGFYRGMSFHRVINGFMAQGGCPFSKKEMANAGTPGTGDPGYRFADEFSKKLRHTGRGVLSMANSGPNTNGSQFFITFVDTPWLDDHHAVFGKIIDGLDVLDKIEAVGSQSGRTSERVTFNIEVVSKRDHAYNVEKLPPRRAMW